MKSQNRNIKPWRSEAGSLLRLSVGNGGRGELSKTQTPRPCPTSTKWDFLAGGGGGGTENKALPRRGCEPEPGSPTASALSVLAAGCRVGWLRQLKPPP